MFVLQHIADALRLALHMFWEVLWPLAVGFFISACVEALVSKQAISRVLGRDSARAVIAASAFGAASSSCSYAAVALARSLFRKGATLANAVIFEFASTNLVVELGIVLLVVLGWQFLTGEIAGGLLMIVLLALLFRITLHPRLDAQARRQAERGEAGRMEGHAAMDMSVSGGSFVQRLLSRRGYTAVSHYYFMNIYSLWSDLVLGFGIAGALAAFVPDAAWARLFVPGHGFASDVVGALIGPIIAMLSFVCSVGNVPLAAVLWRGGISFAGAISFIFGDLIILPILNIYRKYYGNRVSVYLLGVSYATMVIAGLVVGVVFSAFGLVPGSRDVPALDTGFSWDANTWLDITAIAASALLLMRFLRTGGVSMLKAMNATSHAHGSMHHGAPAGAE
jgi:uncharacterized membrane protein YraQ (UPF0718 family)